MRSSSSRLFVACLATMAGYAEASAADPRPNILLIMADDMGFSDVGCYGGEIETPHLDRLASEGLRFTHFYNNAKCGPTRASLLTGLYSQQVGVHGGPSKLQDCRTVAELLGPAGYRTLMVGKWHQKELPTRRGFDRYYGLADGCCNFFNPGKRREGEPEPGKKRAVRRWAIDGVEYRPYTPDDPDFYTTDAFTDVALSYLDEYAGEDRPFFLYVPYTAPHYPLHARPTDIARFRGRYREGWDALRPRRLEKQRKLGIVEKRWPLSPTERRVPAFDSITAEEKRDEWDLKMAVYAAMVHCMDRNIGRLLAKLDELSVSDNTLVLFLSDNGACAEVVHRTPDIPPGPLPSYRTYDPPWASLSNTPFRRYKSSDHEGGIATPLIARWPARLKRAGALVHEIGHIIDLVPTFLDLAGAEYPEPTAENRLRPLAGRSLVPVLEGGKWLEERLLFWTYGGQRAVRRGKWKLVGDKKHWELYDMQADRTELNDLAPAAPERAAELAALYERWKGTWWQKPD